MIAGAIVVVLVLAYLLWPSAAEEGGVEIVAADQRAGQAPPAPPMQVQTPNVLAPPPPAAAPTAPAGVIPEGMTLTGVAGGGAIFTFPDGNQRYVARGRPVVPGVILQAVRLRDVILAAGTTNYRLGLGGAAVPIQAPPAAPPAAGAGGASQLVVPGAPRNAMGGPLISPAQQQQLGQQFVAGLEPRRADGRVTGWVVKPDANLMGLGQAGLQSGDVLVAVNGEQLLDQEQVAGLPQQIADSYQVEFTFERNGQRMTRALQVNPRR